MRDWQKSTSDYTRELLVRGREGAALGRESFLHGTPLSTFLNQSARVALLPAAVGACLGFLGAYPRSRYHVVRRAMACGFLGCAVGFSAGLVWKTRRLAASVASGAWKNMGEARDEHWLQRHPIDYA